MATVPEDLKNLKDFPQYDATFQDHPDFRQKLKYWADNTTKVGNSLSGLADAFDKFHETGMEHYKAASAVISGLQEVSGICRNDSSNTISSYLQQFVDVLNKIWCYYEAFLGQTQMLNATPIRELANKFLGLTTLHQQLQSYRSEQLKAAEKLCSCRHSSKLADRSLLPTLTESCYTSQKTYQLVLSKFVISLRQAHTIDMMSFMRRILEFFLSKYAYHNYCTEVLKDLEPKVNEVFSQTKIWRVYHEREMKLWDKLHVAVKKNVLAQYQHKVAFFPDTHETTPTWSGMAMAPLSAGRQMMKKMFPSQSRDMKQSGPVSAGDGEWEQNEDNVRRATFAYPQEQGGGSATNSPMALRRDTVGEATAENDRMKRHWRRKALRSSSNPDLLAETTSYHNGHLHDDRGGSPSSISSSGETPPPSGLIVTFSEDTTESAADAMEEFLNKPPGHTHFRPLAAVLGGIRSKKKAKKKRQDKLSLSDDQTPPRTQRDGGSPSPLRHASHSSPSPSPRHWKRKTKGSLFLSRSKSHDERGDTAGHLSNVGADQLTGSCENISAEKEERGRRRRKKDAIDGEDTHTPLQPRLKISSPMTRDWSGSELRNEELQSLVQPLPPSWSMAGYLWVRLQTDNRYEWTNVWCVVDKESGEIKVQREEDHTPWCLENLMLCSTKLCTADFIDRNYCFRVISPSAEHLFQSLSSQDQQAWVQALQNCTAQAIKSSPSTQHFILNKEVKNGKSEEKLEVVPDAMKLILSVPGNTTCADCSSSVVEWASINLGLVLCIECSGVHRGLGVHVSKVRSLNLDQWDRHSVNFMMKQGNKKANCYYEATLGTGPHSGLRKPPTNASKAERSEFIQQKYVSLTFTPPLTERTI